MPPSKNTFTNQNTPGRLFERAMKKELMARSRLMEYVISSPCVRKVRISRGNSVRGLPGA